MYDENEVMETEIEESEEIQEVAEPDVEEEDITEESENTQEVAEPEPQSKEQNAAFANMRRQAEAEAQRKMDLKIASLCKDVTHPITGKPITTFAEYEDAISAQNRLQAEAQLKENGVDISVLDEYVNNSPVLAQAQQIIEQNNQAQAEVQIRKDFEELQKLNPDLQTFADIENLNEVIGRVAMGASLVDAYKVVNFDTLMNKGSKSAKQAAINQAKGKSHLEPTESVASDGESVISDAELAILKHNFPEKTDKEIRKLYKQTFRR